MKTLVILFAFERPKILDYCLHSLRRQKSEFDLIIRDDSHSNAVHDLVAKHGLYPSLQRYGHVGFSAQAQAALKIVRREDPEYVYFIEGDHVLSHNAFERIQDVFENTEEGRNCSGISGFDAPNYTWPDYVNRIFPECMKQQVGEDNVNRASLYQDFTVETERFTHTLQRVSNTCFTSYLNWKKIQEIAHEFPELNDYLDQAVAPQDNPNYPTSGEYKRKGVVDDGMLSHGINLVWNRWAMKHGIDRNRFSAWLNVKPSLAQNVNGGGMHSPVPELSTDNGSPTWQG